MSERFWPLLFLLVTFFLVVGLMSFHGSLRNRLGVRIAALILLAGPIALVVFTGFNILISDSFHSPVPWWSRVAQVLVIIVGGPLMLGLLAARYVTKPLRRFNQAITSLKQSDYQVELQPTGIRELDTVFMEFNGLISRLRREEELRKDLISDTSHELNTPLAAMLSQLTAMQEGVLPVTKARVKILAQQTERLTELVAQLNEYTKARSTALLTTEDVHVREICEALRESCTAQLREKHIELAIQIPPQLVLSADRQALERILGNLLQNALCYSGGSSVTITASAAQLVFGDNGQGVPADSLPYLFERFYRVDASRSRETGGLGLGLAIVRELVHRQGWQIRAEDNGPGLKLVITFAG